MINYLNSPYLTLETNECKEKLLPGSSNIWQNDKLKLETKNEGNNFYASIKNISSKDIKISSIELMKIPLGQYKNVNFLRFGFNMPGDPTGFYKIDSNVFFTRMIILVKSAAIV